MSFLDLAKNRYSVRSFKNIPVEEEKLRRILEAGRIAPTAVNFQPFYLVVVREAELKKKVALTYKKEWIQAAPVIIVICGDHSQSWRRGDGKDHCDIDAAIVIDHMTLAATELGLGTCWVCAFDAIECHAVLNLPSHIEAVALLPLGYPEGQPNPERHSCQRKKMEDIVCWDGFLKR